MTLNDLEQLPMIRQCTDKDFDDVLAVVNDAAQTYKGHIPADRWHEPYMSREYLRHEMDRGVISWGYEDAGKLLGLMGIQDVQDAARIRRAYVRTAARGRGIGGEPITHMKTLTTRPTLVCTWAASTWAIRFYEKQGFRPVLGRQGTAAQEVPEHPGAPDGDIRGAGR